MLEFKENRRNNFIKEKMPVHHERTFLTTCMCYIINLPIYAHENCNQFLINCFYNNGSFVNIHIYLGYNPSCL